MVDIEGRALCPNEPGELVMKSYYTFLGYFGQPELTKRDLDESGWFRTGILKCPTLWL